MRIRGAGAMGENVTTRGMELLMDEMHLTEVGLSRVLTSGDVRPGDAISVQLPPRPHARLERV